MNEIESTLRTGVRELVNIIDELPDKQNIEIEIRLGFFEQDGFDTNIHEDFFGKIIDRLQSNPNWDRTETSMYDDYHSKGMRLRISEDGNRQCIKKIRIAHIDLTFDTTPFDVRISICKELNCTIPKNFDDCKARHKMRHSFFHKAHHFLLFLLSSEFPFNQNM